MEYLCVLLVLCPLAINKTFDEDAADKIPTALELVVSLEEPAASRRRANHNPANCQGSNETLACAVLGCLKSRYVECGMICVC